MKNIFNYLGFWIICISSRLGRSITAESKFTIYILLNAELQLKVNSEFS